MKQVQWAGPALDDMAALDKGIARRVKRAVERFAGSGAGDVKRLQGIDPSEYGLRVGDYRVRFEQDAEPPPRPDPARHAVPAAHRCPARAHQR